MEPLALINGNVIPHSCASLALNDAGFVFGATITDLCRTFNQKLYRWPDHLARFRQSSAMTFIPVPYSDEQITAWAHELIAENVKRADRVSGRSVELILVLFATPGPIGYYLGQPGGAGDAPPTFGMHTFPLPFERYRPLIEKGATLWVPYGLQRSADSIDPRIKHRSRLHWWISAAYARSFRPGAQPLLLDAADNVTETSTANLLIVKNGVVIRPPRDAVLNGISMHVIEELCERLEIEMQVRPIGFAEARKADEAILSSTPYCLAGVQAIELVPSVSAAFPTNLQWPGPIMRRLIDAWSADVGVDIHGQFASLAS
jgi:branched-chain amino acid aminotransferase